MRDRSSAAYQNLFNQPHPLVTICIATYNRGPLLLERSVASSLRQTYRNIQVIVVGDCCTDDTARLMATVRDNRLSFVNLPERGNYPTEPLLRWMVAGSVPMNHALGLAEGAFVTHLDDDDEHGPDRVEKLLSFIQQERADLVYHPFRSENESGGWTVNEASRFARRNVTTSSIFYHRWFTDLGWDPLSYRLREPGDWNRLRKIRFLGARTRRHPDILLSHFRERNQRND
ncbi:glycosyltransferase family 2 protein [Sphingosinicella rhizophila]|uniref:Glycosyltransferase family 2 protein n=1 Tax=Sphingosinicella rhizophila TaxID=3050082 RepID=A0ABU3Q664_9SPHN|nr:glycosyltransferase family 2 protein [Sphingosinicella sp. GR2756]MDT9598895.1 glycosyltransferase family 2 protein [Sphingosinicella sp. GR2756]